MTVVSGRTLSLGDEVACMTIPFLNSAQFVDNGSFILSAETAVSAKEHEKFTRRQLQPQLFLIFRALITTSNANTREDG